MLTSFRVNAYSFRSKYLLLFPKSKALLPPEPGFSLPKAAVRPFFSPEASETNRSSVSEKCYSVSFCAMILQMANTSDLSTQIFRNIFCLYMIRKIRNTIR